MRDIHDELLAAEEEWQEAEAAAYAAYLKRMCDRLGVLRRD